AAGKLKHNGRGDLIIGYTGSQQDQSKLEATCELFTRANIQCLISDNIKGELWAKLIINCAYNAISALTQSNYTSMMSNQLIKDMMISVVEECQAIVKADGIKLPNENILEPVLALANSMGNAVSSTAQDLARGKATEIDAFNGYVMRRGLALGVPTPVNTTLYSLVKHLEKSLVK
ncbi:MAG: 2-dehydropantoate 2-reductase, partial [Candidatus Obscuribacterales bacterium]|nr:2-dehydropantoate 2-reductase [Candidatus Obscuribacterales bacterium]